jgi:hypothetical protein
MKNIVFGVLLLVSFASWGQVQDPESPGFDFDLTGDSTQSESSEDGDAPAQEAAKPYERIVLAMDSNTNLIEYIGVVEQEESSGDSLYFRAKNFANTHLSGDAKGKKGAVYEVDKKGQKLVIDATMPAYSYQNKYAKKPMGSYHFKMTVLFREGRYKYTITNLVHEGIKPAAGDAKRNYFEYYYNTTTNIKGVDAILRYADKDIQEMIVQFKKALREPLFIDEDDW